MQGKACEADEMNAGWRNFDEVENEKETYADTGGKLLLLRLLNAVAVVCARGIGSSGRIGFGVCAVSWLLGVEACCCGESYWNGGISVFAELTLVALVVSGMVLGLGHGG